MPFSSWCKTGRTVIVTDGTQLEECRSEEIQDNRLSYLDCVIGLIGLMKVVSSIEKITQQYMNVLSDAISSFQIMQLCLEQLSYRQSSEEM